MIETTVERITPSETIIKEPTPQEKKRYLGIDVFRGIAIVGMIFVNTLAEYDATPWWTKHAADFGLTYVDLIAPFFIFAIALTYKMSFTRSVEREGCQLLSLLMDNKDKGLNVQSQPFIFETNVQIDRTKGRITNDP